MEFKKKKIISIKDLYKDAFISENLKGISVIIEEKEWAEAKFQFPK